MKKFAFMILFLSSVCLHAQQAAFHETRIYVPPIDGVGMIDDMAYFYKQITGEITNQYRTLGRTRLTSDYVITGKLMPLTPDELATAGIPPNMVNDEWILYIELFNNAMGETIGNQFLTYSYPDDTTNESLSVIIYNMLSGIPDLIEGIASYDAWRNKWLYTSLSFLWVPRVYSGAYQSVNIASVGGEMMLDFHFLSFLSLKLGIEVVQDRVVMYSDSSSAYSDMILDVPLALSFVMRPLDVFLMEPYIGVSYNLSLMNYTKPYPLSWLVGFDLGVKIGPGMLTIDPRFNMDFGPSQILISSRRATYWRYTIHLGIGYKIGFWDRKR